MCTKLSQTFYVFQALIKSSSYLHTKNVYSSRYIRKYSVVCCYYCAGSFILSLYHLAGLETKYFLNWFSTSSIFVCAGKEPWLRKGDNLMGQGINCRQGEATLPGP